VSGVFESVDITGTDTLTVTGNVGIGTTTPAASLEINTDENWSAGWRNNLKLESIYYPSMRFHATNVDKTAVIGNNNDGGLWFSVNGAGDGWGSYGMVIEAGGDVGIGTTAPSDKLEVYANGANVALRIHEDAGTHEAKLHLRRGGNDWEIINNSDLAIEIEDTEVFRIDTDGNVGIGTTDPQYYKLHLNDADTSTLAIQCNGNNATGSKIRLIEGSANFLGAYMHYDGSTNKFNLGVHDTSNSTLADDTAAITIDRTTAFVGIGSTSPTVELDVASTDFDGSMKWTHDSLFLHNTGDKNQIIVGCKANSPTGSYFRLTEGPNTVYQGGYIQYDGLLNNLNIGVNDGGTAFTHDVAAITIERETAYVGIGSASPTTQLDVVGTGLFSEKVGIGTNAPTSALEVRGGNIDIGTNRIQGFNTSCKIEMSAANVFKISNENNGHGIDFYADDLNLLGGALGYRKIITDAGNLSIEPVADLLLNENGGSVGIGIANPSEALEVSGNVEIGESNGPGDETSWLRINGYDEHGIELRSHGTWTNWRISSEVNGNLELYNTGASDLDQQVYIGHTEALREANVMVWTTGSALRAGRNSTTYPILDFGIQDAVHGYNGDAYIDVRTSTTPPSRFHFKKDGEFIASGVSVTGTVAGTGDGGRITLNGTPYLLSGDAAAALTLQDVCDNDNSTTTSILSTGPHISGVSGLFGERVGIATDAPTNNLHIVGTMQLDNSVSDAFKIRLNGNQGLAYDHDSISSTNAGYDITIQAGKELIFKTYDGGFNEAMRIDTDGNVGIGTTIPTKELAVVGDIWGYSSAPAGTGDAYSVAGGSALDGNTRMAGLRFDRLNDVAKFGCYKNTSLIEEGYIAITSGGLVGIGTTDPSVTFHVNSQALDAVAQFESTDGWADLHLVDSATTQEQTLTRIGDNLTLLRNGGNVGIGTTAPAYKLHVNSSTTDEVARFGSSDNVAYITITDSAETGVTGFIGVDNIGGPKAPNMSIGLNSSMTSSSNLYITTGGRLGVGHNDPNHQLTVGGSIRATDDIELGPDSEIDWHNGNNKIVAGLVSDYSLSFQAYGGATHSSATYTKIFIHSSGNVGIGTTAPLARLDVRGDISGSGSFLGTGVGNRITNNGTPYLLSGDSPAETQTLQQVCDRGNYTLTNVGIGTSPTNALDVVGHFTATSKAFLIDHPTKETKKLQYASLEGPENAIYVRGTHNSSLIELPEYWSELVHEDSLTVSLTPLGKHQNLYVKSKDSDHISVGGVKGSYDYVVYGERKDIDKLEVELPKV